MSEFNRWRWRKSSTSLLQLIASYSRKIIFQCYTYAGNDEEIVKFQIQGAKDVVLESARSAATLR